MEEEEEELAPSSLHVLASSSLAVPLSIGLASSHLFSLAAAACCSKMLNGVFSFSTLAEPASMCSCRISSTCCCCSESHFRGVGPSPTRFPFQEKRHQPRSSSSPFPRSEFQPAGSLLPVSFYILTPSPRRELQPIETPHIII